jgi:molybdopterin-binding protein
VRLDGVELKHDDVRARRRMAGVFQRAILFSGTVRDNVAFGVRAAPAAEKTRVVDAALEWLGLGPLARAQVSTLSGGEAQRVALARALVLEPDVLLLDEPSAGLDATVRSRFLHELDRAVRSHARGVIMITHDPRDAFGLADRIAVMHNGRIVQIGTPDDIMLRPATIFAAELTGAELLLHGIVADVNETLARVTLTGGDVLLGTIAAGETLDVGDAVHVAYRPEDIVIARDAAASSSAVNRLDAAVIALAAAGAHVRAQLRSERSGVTLSALLTRGSVEELGITTGLRVTAQLKASALHLWRGEARPQQRRVE